MMHKSDYRDDRMNIGAPLHCDKIVDGHVCDEWRIVAVQVVVISPTGYQPKGCRDDGQPPHSLQWQWFIPEDEFNVALKAGRVVSCQGKRQPWHHTAHNDWRYFLYAKIKNKPPQYKRWLQ